MSPADAVARHLEWLDFALAAATAEATWRQERLAKASNRNRKKREERAAEIAAEVSELTALIAGLRELVSRRTRKAPVRARATTAGKRTKRSRTSGAGSRPRKTSPAAGPS